MKVSLVVILAVALLIRLYGIDFGLPYIYDPDESILVRSAVRILNDRDLNPHWFGWPGSTNIYILSALYAFIFLGGLGLGIFSDVEGFRALYFQDPTIFYISGRLISVVFAVATILLVYLISRRFFNQMTGLVAAIFIALSPVHVFYSKFIRPDVLVGFLILVTFWFCLNILEKHDLLSYILAGLFTGLAIATKYPAVIVLLIIGLAHFASRRWQIMDHSKLFVSGIACLVGVFCASPFLFLDFQNVLSDVIWEARPMHLSATGEGLIKNYVWYLKGTLSNAITAGGLLIVSVGISLSLLSKQKSKWLLVAFTLFFLLFIASLSLRWERWVIPVIPFLCVLLAYGVYEITRFVGQHLNSQIALWIGFFLIALVSVPLFKTDILQGREMSGMDTRTLARQWMISNIPAGSRILLERYTPQLPKRLFKYFVAGANGVVVEVDVEKLRHADFRAESDIGTIRNIADIQRQNIEYMAMSNMYDRYRAERKDYPEIVATYEELMKFSSLVYEVNAQPGKVGGPRIRIYKMNWNQ